MITSNDIYEIISELQFSIKGYESDDGIDSSLHNLLKKLHNKKDVLSNLKINFFSFANARLSNVSNWQLADYDKSFYFVPFLDSPYEAFDLNEYYALKGIIKEYNISASKDKVWSDVVLSGKAAQISSAVFNNPIIFRVLCDSSINNVSITYDCKILNILIPQQYFKFYNPNESIDDIEEHLPLIKTGYEYIPNHNAHAYIPQCENFIRYIYNDLCSKIISELESLNKHYSLFKIYQTAYFQDAIRGFANLLITHAYLSLILHCWVESIPSIVSINKKRHNSLGIVIWGYDKKCDVSEHRAFIKIIADKICSCFAAHFIDLLGLVNKIQTESIKSAKAAIMSRNMSHNLGSHVMFYIKQKLQSVSKIINNDVLHNIITGSQLNIKELQEKLQNSANIELPFLVGLGRFINYLQERQDYIATVATNYIPARSTISFKDFIYDELKPDLRYERHKRDDSSSDNGWQPKNLLLDYIAYSEGYSKSDAIEIKFGEFDGHNPLDDTAKGDFQALRKFNVAVPGGVIGRQAIFSIVENIIRNAAKHSEHRRDGKLVLQLSLVDAEKDFAAGRFEPEKFRCMRKEKGSMESGESLVKLYQNHKDTFHILRIKLDMPNKEDDIEALVGKLGEDYVEEDGSMKETSKGLKEMRISAAWLRGHSIDTAIPTTEPPVLAVYSEPYKDYKDKETISYYLCIPKPCKVAFVVEDMAKYTALNDEIKPFGCQIFEYVEQNEKNQDNKEAVRTFRNQIADYEIVCMDLEEGKRDCILPYISSRYITNSATTKSILDELERIAKPSKGSDQEGKNNETQYAQIKTAIDSIYEKWFEETYGKVNNKLLITDDKTCEKHQTRNVKDDASQNNTANDLGVILRATGTAKKEDCENSVIYSTHFAGLYKAHCSTNDKDATKSGYELLQSGASIEAITGNNSTDRLIRQDEWNKEWKYKHLSAGLARVAIFDERIFGSFITEKSSNSVDHNKVSNLLNKHKREPMSKEDIKTALINLNFKSRHAESLAIAIINERPINWGSFYKQYQKPEYYGQVAQTNYERRTWAFNIQADENSERTMKILGYDAMIGDNLDWADENVHKQPIEIATFKDEDGEYKITLSAEGKKIFTNGNSRIFHYITIHQGILDKIYNVFGIKENEKEKYKVTHALHRFFSKPPLSKETEKKHKSTESFLPNFIIHSGRSKPNEKDMPQHQPFVQFAAIDHAVKDCKYTLVELLATAHYEQGSNNN